MNTQALTAFVRKNPLGLGCGLVVVVLGVVIFLRSGSLPELRQQLADKTAEGKRLSDNIKYASQLQEQYEAVVQAGKAIEPRILNASELARNLQYFYKLEADTGTKLTDLREMPVSLALKNRGSAKYIGVPFNIGIEGDYRQAVEFLRRLEQGNYYSRFMTLSMSLVAANQPTRSGAVRLNFNVELLGQP